MPPASPNILNTRSHNLKPRQIRTRTGYAIILPTILGVLVVVLAVYLVFWSRKRKVKAKEERKRAREQNMRTWGRDMGEPDMRGKKVGGDKLLLASQGVGMGLAVLGR